MATSNAKQPKLELDYPCSWTYKLIATDKIKVECAIDDVMGDRQKKLTHSKNSKAGRYTSMSLELLVHNEDDRNYLYETFKKHPNIKMVL